MNYAKQPLASCSILAFGLFLAASAASANPRLRIDDLTDTVTFNVAIITPMGGTTTGFTSFTANGLTPDNNGDITGLSEAAPITFTGIWADSGTGGTVPTFTATNPRSFYFVEGPLNTAGGIGQTVSDVLTVLSIINTSGTSSFTVVGSFSSDNETGGLGLVPSGTPLGRISIENGTFQNFFTPGELRIQGRSDLPERVPEPATLALLGFGLAGLAASRRRRPS